MRFDIKVTIFFDYVVASVQHYDFHLSAIADTEEAAISRLKEKIRDVIKVRKIRDVKNYNIQV